MDSINRRMDFFKDVVHLYNGILLSHKRNKFESLIVRWMNLEPLIQSEVKPEREKQVSSINTCMLNLEK